MPHQRHFSFLNTFATQNQEMLTNAIFNIKNEAQFNELAMAVFAYQFEHNTLYRSFCDLLYKHPSDITSIQDIPFLPISFFKSHQIISSLPSAVQNPEVIFESSGTTGVVTSKHYVTDIDLYRKSFITNFQYHYGPIKNYVILALLPSYLERSDSSLVFMVSEFIQKTGHPDSGFYLHEYSALSEKIRFLEQKGQKTLLIGVSYALMDLVEKYQFELNHTIVMETGGMKGRRKELVRNELHTLLCDGFGVDQIHSEYGMTELLSQAYSKGGGSFTTPPWMHILIRDPEDPLTLQKDGVSGGLNIIDLCNINSCAFIATQDIGRYISPSSFSVLGRFDHADIRGCNLMSFS